MNTNDKLEKYFVDNYGNLLSEYREHKANEPGLVLGAWLVDFYPGVVKDWFYEEGQ